MEITTSLTREVSDEELKNIKATVKKQREMVNRGRNRIQEKAKDIRQNYSMAVVNGTRSGSGKNTYEHFEKLASIWGGSASTEPLSFGIANFADKIACHESMNCQELRKLNVVITRPLRQMKKAKVKHATLRNQLCLLRKKRKSMPQMPPITSTAKTLHHTIFAFTLCNFVSLFLLAFWKIYVLWTQVSGYCRAHFINNSSSSRNSFTKSVCCQSQRTSVF